MALGENDVNTHSTPVALMIAGFGDSASMFDPLMNAGPRPGLTMVNLDLPGFGCPPLDAPTSLQTLADFVLRTAVRTGATVLLAHSVASIIAALAAERAESPITTIVSLEGNLTAEDAYFSGTAADHPDPHSFRSAFLERLQTMSAGNAILDRYRKQVAKADPRALWELGCDARRFSEVRHPGEHLKQSARVHYLYNPDNCPEPSKDWLRASGLPATVLTGASHWPTLDQPKAVATAIRNALGSKHQS